MYTGSKGTREEFELWDGDKKLLTLHYDQSIGSARVDYGDEKRALLINREGFRKNKTVLRNEYGYRIGKLVYEKWQSPEGLIDFNQEQFNYTINNGNNPELVIYRQNSLQALTTCSVTMAEGKSSKSFKEKYLFPSVAYHSLLLTLCWYLFNSVGKPDAIQLAY
jgi:hypothetical protein